MILAVLVSLGVAHGGAADEPKTADAVLTQAAAKLESCQTWSGDFRQSMNMLGGPMAFSGHMSFKQPRQMRMEMDMPMMGQQGKMLMVLGPDRVMWQQMEFGGQQKVIKMNMTIVMSNVMTQPAWTTTRSRR